MLKSNSKGDNKIPGTNTGFIPGIYLNTGYQLLFAGGLELLGFLAGLALRQVVHDRRTYEY